MKSKTPNGAKMPNLIYDQSDIDPASTEVVRYAKWATPALTGSPPYAFSAVNAVELYLLTKKPEWAQLAVNMVEKDVTAAETAIAAKKSPEIAADSYLEIGGRLSGLALTYAFCPQVTEAQKTRWGAYAE